MVAFSVWISAIGSSSWISSPSLLSHRRTVPSSIASPIFGIVSSAIHSPNSQRRGALAPQRPLDRRDHALLVRHGELLQRPAVRDRHVLARHPLHWRIQLVEQLLVDACHHLG